MPTNTNGSITCECETGWKVTKTCTQIYGCISSHSVNNQTICYACDTLSNFAYQDPHNCTCKRGYSLNIIATPKKCEIICGDKLYVTE